MQYRTQVGEGEGRGRGGGEGEGEADIDVINAIACYVLPIDCILIALFANIFSHNGYGPGHISIMAEHTCVKGNQQAIDTQYVTGNLTYYMSYSQNISKEESRSQHIGEI